MKAEHFERQVQRLEQERDAWEKKYEVSVAFYSGAASPVNVLIRCFATGRRSEVQGLQGGARRSRREHGRPLIPSRLSMYYTASFLMTDDTFRQSFTMSRCVRHDGNYDHLPPIFTLHIHPLDHFACV